MIPGSGLRGQNEIGGAQAQAQGNAQAPEQIHIALAGNNQGVSNAMAVSWATPSGTKTSIVKYGTTSGHYDHVAKGSQRTYNTEWYYHHEAVMVNLMPKTTHYYVVGDETSGFSDEFSFVTAPNNNVDRPLTLMTYGKCGTWL